MATLQKRPKRRWWAVAARPQTSPTPPIDGSGVTGVAAAYSLRRLRSAYVGPAVNIRRSSDNAVQDVGFANNVFDATAYAAFVGGGTAFAAKWYDQSGNAADGIQATAGNQPTVMPDGIGYALNTTTASAQVLAAPDAAPIQNVFATGGYLQVVLHCSSGAGVGTLIAKGSATAGWLLYCFPGGGEQTVWHYQKAATSDGFWGSNNVITQAGRHVVTVAYNAATPATAPVITLDGTVTTLQPTAPVGAAVSDVGFPLQLLNNNVISTNNAALAGSIYEVILIRGTPSAGIQAALNANARTFYQTS
jgi:hypothetical protein